MPCSHYQIALPGCLLAIRECCSFTDCAEQSTDSFTGREGQRNRVLLQPNERCLFSALCLKSCVAASYGAVLIKTPQIHTSFRLFQVFLFWCSQVTGMESHRAVRGQWKTLASVSQEMCPQVLLLHPSLLSPRLLSTFTLPISAICGPVLL